MRRILFTVAASVMIAAAAPATALAHKGRHHHHHHHVRVHHRQFGRVSDSAGNAGTVASFDMATNKLTIQLNDGSMVTGTVTPDTEIECNAADMPAHDSFFRKDDHGGSGDQGDDNDNDDMANCGTAALTPGTAVHEAKLRISGDGATWDKVELAAPTGSMSTTDS